MKTLLLGLVLLGCSATCWADLNERSHLPPSVQVKVNKHIAQAYIRGNAVKAQAGQGQDGDASGGGTQVINSFSNVRQAPKEVVTAVRGDIVNVCFHCQ